MKRGIYHAAFLAVITLRCPASVVAQPKHDPVADSRATVTVGKARFTILTPQMIRMEWAADGRFEDRPSLVFLNRRLPVPEFRTETRGESRFIETSALRVRYQSRGGRAEMFDSMNLEVHLTVGGRPVVWRPGTSDTGNLGGTIRTLDGVQGPVPLEPGLLSRDGWTVIDDTFRPVFDDSDWPWVETRPPGDRLDWYFLGYGHDYISALRDFTLVSGKMPMPPRFAFGNWWSRYWAYTDQEMIELVEDFDTFDVPLDVLVIDMDWHETFELRWGQPAPEESSQVSRKKDQAGEPLGWTGYTWNGTYFPDPEKFLAWAAERGLRTPLNLHPASGIQPHESRYPAMAQAMGIDPATQRYVPFRIEDKDFAQAYFEHVIHPLERQGVDFWWLDWQQWHETSIPGLTPTWWLNYVFFTEMERRAKERPILFHRYGGLGNHRYPIGFSGDAHSTWEALSFEPHFTATASNVLYGYWSHDIGGHLWGEISPELYTRWIQFGILSPVFRTHTTKNPKAERRIWAYPVEYFQAMRDAIHLRYALIPYIYTAARKAYDTGLSIVRPMYYDHPEQDEAYTFSDQYRFGDDLLVSPVVAPVSTEALLARRSIWLPEGEWVEWSTGTRISGGRVIERDFAIDEIPVYARAGAVVPMQPEAKRVEKEPVDPLILTVFPGTEGRTRVYEDEGNTLDYQKDVCAWTPIRHETGPDGEVRIRIGPVEGLYPGMLTERAYQIRLVNVLPPVRVRANATALVYRAEGESPGWRYDGNQLSAIISLARHDVAEAVDVVIDLPRDIDTSLVDGVPGLLSRLARSMSLLNSLWPQDWAPETLIDLVQTGRRITLDPTRAVEELERLRRDLPRALDDVRRMEGDRATIDRALLHLNERSR